MEPPFPIESFGCSPGALGNRIPVKSSDFTSVGAIVPYKSDRLRAAKWRLRYGPVSLRRASGMLLIVVIMLFPQAMLWLKVAVLLCFLGMHGDLWFFRVTMVRREICLFYLLTAFGGLTWCLVGYLNGGDPVGIADAFRLRVIWSAIFFLIFSSFCATLRHCDLHRAICAAVLLVGVVNLLAVLDSIYSLGLLSDGFTEEMNMQFGYKDGFTRLNSINIATLLFAVPYLIAYILVSERFSLGSAVCLMVGVAVSVLSGRRALWLTIALTPLVVIFSALCLSRWRTVRRVILLQTAIGALAIGYAVLFAGDVATLESVNNFVLQAFSADDERVIQFGYLMEAHRLYPIMGSGFGVGAGYVRSETRPWTYELTYVQMLFNLGWVGTTYVVGIFVLFTARAAHALKIVRSPHAVEVALFTGSLAIIMAANSNPYMGSFDFLFYLGFLPYLSERRLPRVAP